MKKAAHAFTEASKSPEPQGKLAHCRLRRDGGFIPVQVRRPQTAGRPGCNSSLKAGKVETQEELMFQFESKGRKQADVSIRWLPGGKNSPSYSREARPFCSSQPSTDWSRPTHIRNCNLLCSVY